MVWKPRAVETLTHGVNQGSWSKSNPKAFKSPTLNHHIKVMS